MRFVTGPNDVERTRLRIRLEFAPRNWTVRHDDENGLSFPLGFLLLLRFGFVCSFGVEDGVDSSGRGEDV